MENQKNNLIKDIGIIILSVIVGIILIKTGTIEKILEETQNLWFLDSFVAGIFFTSIFTTIPAIVALGEIAQLSDSVMLVAIFGGLGAVCGDLIIFRFMRDRFGEDILSLIRNSKNSRLRSMVRLKSFKWMTFILGALIIASPLPDELGLTMMGFSKTKTWLFIPVSFVFNFLGILVIGLIAKNLLGN
ncbi:hypothetical protein A2917_00030 [Candidatus Nomurabacteria bacterium RIFCSPLOWO2_01_FULL_42_17]|uniref:Uncharacterized protein n=1 Tax=Candidatus Nomurabacteria bacterium RIFCSPLOWO2_01_FULL_42_17 TaxID=1801780 RepID=A0A1F6XNH5_9BACT|nr:MAG: hypothetical protein A2917_00030 [Candidatus Nomurabacteria bacterium RIFCSPLOWO2_01_FULL_42_17]